MHDIKLNKLSHFFAPLLLLLAFVALAPAVSAQTAQIRGTITERATGETIIGANIIEVGTTNGTVTDIDGNYTLTARRNATLRISAIGFLSQDIAVPNVPTAVLNIQMMEDVKLLEEVVVVGYGTQRKSEITASVASLREEDFNATIASASALELAMGRIPGLLITSGNQSDPRSGVQIQIRGTSSMRGSNSPLIVIDGIPGGDLGLIPPEDISNISVLKDASAAAIYGTRGANGVILVTTKKGRQAGELRSTFEYSGVLSHEYIYKQPDMLTAAEYRDYMQSGGYNTHMMVDFGHDTNWQELMTNKNNFSHTHNLSMRGGTQTSNYRASLYYRAFDPIAIESQNTNWGARMTVNHLGLNDRLEVQLNFNSDFRERNMLGRNDEWEQAAQRNPTGPSKDENGNWYEDGAYNSFNPLARYATTENDQSRGAWMLSQRSTLTVIDGLKIGFMTSHTQNNTTRNEYRYRNSKSSIDTYQGGGYAQKWSSKDVHQVMSLTADYSNIFNEIHSLNIIAGHDYEYQVSESFNAFNTGFMTDAFKTNDIGGGTGITRGNTTFANMSSSKRDNKLAAFFGRINYSFQDKYLFSATLRMDGSSRFGANYRWGTFPAVSGGWILSQEEFMKDIPFVNYLKVRIGYGITGNLPGDGSDELGISGNYSYMITMNQPNSRMKYPISGNWYTSFGPARNPNPDLKWEEKREFNFGLDFSILKDRIGGTIDVYRRLTVDIIDNYNSQMPPMILNTITTNVGSMSNTGVEIGLNAKVINQRDIKYDANMTFIYQKNVLVSLSSDVYQSTFREWGSLPAPGALGNAFRSAEGEPTGQFYGKRFAGFTENGQWLFYKADNTIVPLSEMVPEDLTSIGNGTPKFHASLNNSFKYKNIELSLFFRGRFGFQILNTKELYFGNRNWFPNNVLKSAITTHAELRDAPQYSDYYLENGNFVKLQNMSLGYNFILKNRTWVRTLRVYTSWQNVFTITKYSGMTPDLRDTGFVTGLDSRGFFPVTSQVMFGVNVGF